MSSQVASTHFPTEEWDRVSPATAGFDIQKFAELQSWWAHQSEDRPYRLVAVRHGRIVLEMGQGIAPDERLGLASAAKSIFSCMLAIAVNEGKIGSADDRVVDYYPALMDVPKGTGPKPGRYAFEKDRTITFRQLISNTSGYMKPGEDPGKVFHYQTYGMNILSHAIASAYGAYDLVDPEGSPGLRALIREKIGVPLGADWGEYQFNFDLQAAARLNIFGYYDGIMSTARDMARLGWLWCNNGNWHGQQLIPADWLPIATRTAPDILANCPPEQWTYGHGFWTNEHGKLWPDLPRDSFAASGAGQQHIWVCPGLQLVVVHSPGLYEQQTELNEGFLLHIIEAVND